MLNIGFVCEIFLFYALNIFFTIFTKFSYINLICTLIIFFTHDTMLWYMNNSGEVQIVSQTCVYITCKEK